MGVMSSICRRSAAEAAGVADSAAQAGSRSHGSRSNNGSSGTLEQLSQDEARKRGRRPNAPAYSDTPLLTVGKEVQIWKQGGVRTALIECVDETDGTVDISYLDGDEEEDCVATSLVRPLDGMDAPKPNDQADAKKKAADRTSLERRRLMGIRPNAPAYKDTPLLSIGKQVRVQREATCQRATIECVNQDECTVDIAYFATAEGEEQEDATVPFASVMPLEEFETREESSWQSALSDDFYGSISACKEGANALFKLKDFDAASAYYGIAIDKLRDPHVSDLGKVLLIQSGTLVLGKVTFIDPKSQKAEILLHDAGSLVRGVSIRTLVPVHEKHLVLQSSLYMNRARSFTQIGCNQEAAQDLSVVIGLWGTQTDGAEQREQLTKAHYLRAKTRLSRMKIEPARADVKTAWSLQPPEATAKLLRQIEREVDAAQKEKIRSNKRLVKEISKFADDAMSKMNDQELEALGMNFPE